jgi:hypothetical protein
MRNSDKKKSNAVRIFAPCLTLVTQTVRLYDEKKTTAKELEL